MGRLVPLKIGNNIECIFVGSSGITSSVISLKEEIVSLDVSYNSLLVVATRSFLGYCSVKSAEYNISITPFTQKSMNWELVKYVAGADRFIVIENGTFYSTKQLNKKDAVELTNKKMTVIPIVGQNSRFFLLDHKYFKGAFSMGLEYTEILFLVQSKGIIILLNKINITASLILGRLTGCFSIEWATIDFQQNKINLHWIISMGAADVSVASVSEHSKYIAILKTVYNDITVNTTNKNEQLGCMACVCCMNMLRVVDSTGVIGIIDLTDFPSIRAIAVVDIIVNPVAIASTTFVLKDQPKREDKVIIFAISLLLSCQQGKYFLVNIGVNARKSCSVLSISEHYFYSVGSMLSDISNYINKETCSLLPYCESIYPIMSLSEEDYNNDDKTDNINITMSPLSNSLLTVIGYHSMFGVQLISEGNNSIR